MEFEKQEKKSHGLRSGKYWGCGTTGIPFLVKNSFTETAVWGSVVVMQHPSVRTIWPDTNQGLHNSTDRSDCQTLIRPHKSPHSGHIFIRFWRARSSGIRFIFHTLKWPSKNALCHLKTCALNTARSPWDHFNFPLSFCCVFVRFDTKFGHVTLLEISFLHFCNASLPHTLTQLAVKSDVLLSWNLHWTSSGNVRLGWCWRCGYSIASSPATRSVSLHFRPILCIESYHRRQNVQGFLFCFTTWEYVDACVQEHFAILHIEATTKKCSLFVQI